MKIVGAELKQWMDEAWPGDDWYWDHELFEDIPDPAITYDTDELGGGLFYQGKDPDQPPEIDMAKAIRKWRKTRGRVAVVYLVPVEAVGAADKAMAGLGATKSD